MSQDVALTSCCQSRRYMDRLIYLPTHAEFAKVPRCAACHKFKGPVSVLYTAPKGLAAKWTGSAEAAMLEHFSKASQGRPLWFEDGAFLRPVGYKGEVKQQGDLAEEPPF